MPEYLAPGVFVEETSFRAKSIEGVSTTTTAFIGPTRYGPTEGEPELLTSYNEFDRRYGGLDRLEYAGGSGPVHNYMAHAVRAFFANGGKRLYVVRTFKTGEDGDGRARANIPPPASSIGRAREGARAAAATAGAALSGAEGAASVAATVANQARTAAVEVIAAAITGIQATGLAGLAVDASADGFAGIQQKLQDAIDDGANAGVKAEAEAARDAALPRIQTAAEARDTATGIAATVTATTTTISSERPKTGTVIEDGNAAAVPPDPPISAEETSARADTAAAAVATAGAEAELARQAADASREAARKANVQLNAASSADRAARAKDAADAAKLAADNGSAAATKAAAAISAAVAASSAARLVEMLVEGQPPAAEWLARYPGAAGNITIRVTARLGPNVLSQPRAANGQSGPNRVGQLIDKDLVLLRRPAGNLLTIVNINGPAVSFGVNGDTPLNTLNVASDEVRPVTFSVDVLMPGLFAQPFTWESLTTHPDRRDSVTEAFNVEISNPIQEIETPVILDRKNLSAVELATALLGPDGAMILGTPDPARPGTVRTSFVTTYVLGKGDDGQRPTAIEYAGKGGENDPTSSGLVSLEDLEEISILAAPGLTFDLAHDESAKNEAEQAVQELINHCEKMRYRVAVLDSPDHAAISTVRDYRAPLDTTRAALYYPWVRVQDPVTRQPIHLPPSGFVAGIYARNDISRGVHKAPANEIVAGAIGLETLINKGQQEILNPLGINCLRYFENRGNRVWGARTLSSDPEWKYLNIRRYFAYLERSIEKSTQWAVFEPNGEALWANVRRAVEDFLYNEWSSERLAGTKPSEAYFVACDRTTMTQNDLDNGRMICLIGVAPLYPAEFVIFRIGQWTADAGSRS